MTTKRFKLSAGSVIAILVPKFIIQWRDLIFILLFVMLCFSTVRLEYALVSLMVIFLIAPMGLLFLFAYYAFLPEMCIVVLEKTATFSDDGVLYEYYRKVEKEDSEALADEVDDEWYISHSTMFSWEQFIGYERRRDMILLVFNDRRYKFLAIPYSAFVDSPQFTKVLEIIKCKTSK